MSMCADEEIAPGSLWRMLVLELWHRNFMESRNQWNAEHRPPDIFVHETGQASQSEGP